jgi:alpha-galactosidase
LFFAVVVKTAGQSSFASWTSSELTLTNGKVLRTIHLPVGSGSFQTTIYKPVPGEFKYFKKVNTEFQFEIDNASYSGKSSWKLVKIDSLSDKHGGRGASVTLQSTDQKIQLVVNYLLYPGLPLIRKNLVIRNLSNKTVALESVDVERFDVTDYFANTFSWICHDYGRRRSIGPYEGNLQDALVTVHNSDWRQGIVIGNETAGVLKRTAVFWEDQSVVAGLTHKDSRYPFRKWLRQNEEFETPQVFTIVYNDCKDPDLVLNTYVQEFVRKHMGTRLSALVKKPTFVYNTWVPFRAHINEQLIMELAKAAADAGMKEFIIDDGWETNFGDWEIDRKKFPHGLKPVFDYIKSLGMKPGLWVSVGSASPGSKVYQEHPEWFVVDKKGRYTNLEYLKLDFTVVTSPYRFCPDESGCYATNHPGHVDHHESLGTNYERVWQLFDTLHLAKSNLFIDCTFETMGGLQLIDYALLKHAEGDWLSNFNGPDEKVDLRIRNMAWWRSPAMPATALVTRNPEMQDEGWELHLQSVAGALPIMLGDPRKLLPSDLKKYRLYADWLQRMEDTYGIMSYRQDLPGFGEPLEGMWDGFQRINTNEGGGGIVGVFKQGAADNEHLVTIGHLNPQKNYGVREAVSGKVVKRATGVLLATKGFSVTITSNYGGMLYEIFQE